MEIQDASRSIPYAVIEDIRKRKGIGSGTRGGDNEEDLHRAIKHLSDDLYSKDIHFILELIQNAEDNPYSPEKEPQLIFKILNNDPTGDQRTFGSLLVINNERGFQEENVRAICKVGASTKSKRDGYIGEKGIGFKSVFLVTSRPHIFSAGYQFYFQDTADAEAGFGFIVPYWVNEIPDIVQTYSNQTCILLPLKFEARENVESGLRQIAPETILFLNKLKALGISIEDEHITEVYRVDEHFPKVELHTNGFVRTYWLCEKELPVPEGLKEEKREGIPNRKVSVAFPIDDNALPDVTLYAFLPTSPNLVSGLDFLVNADFLLSASREQIQEHRPWNQWLRDSIPSVFLDGFDSMLRDENMRIKAYSFIPLEKRDRSPFFCPVVSAILSELRAKEVLLTISGDFVKPDIARFATKELRSLFGKDPAPSQLQKTKLVATDLENISYRERLKSIGVKELTEKEIINCIKDEEWIEQRDISWFFDLYKYLQSQRWATKDALDRFRIIPTSDGNLYCPADTSGIYLPTPEANEELNKYKEAIEFSGVNFLDSGLYNLIHTEPKLEEWAKEHLELFELNASMICQELAIKLKANLDEINEATLVWATKFICNHLGELSDNQKDIVKKNLPVALSNKKIILPKDWCSENPLVFPENFDVRKGWQIMFPDVDDREHMYILSKKYLSGVAEEDYKKWEKFFIAVGATQSPYPRKLEWTFWWSSPNDVADHQKEWIGKSRRKSSDYTFQDWKAPGWLKSTKNASEKPNISRARALVSWLENQIDEINEGFWYCDWLRASLSYFYYSNRSEHKVSELHFLIQNASWVPTTKGLHRPSEVFLDRPEIKEFFGNSVPYSKLRMSDDLVKWLNIRTSATFDEVLDLLKTLATHPPEEAETKFVSRLYAFLSERWKTEARKEFISQSLILLTRPNHQWLKLNEVIWPDRSEVFGDAFGYLEPEYANLRTFFVERLNVKKDVDDEAYAQAWLNLSQSTETLPASQVEAALERIFPVLLKVTKSSPEARWWNTWVHQVEAWTQKDSFSSPNSVFIPDDGLMQKILGEAGAKYVWRPRSNSFADYEALYTAIGVRSLVQSTKISSETEPVSENEEVDTPIYLTNMVKRAICWYLRNDGQTKEIYQQLKENGKLEQLLKTKELTVNHLRITFRLESISAVIDEGVTYWDRENKNLYVSNQYSSDDVRVEIPSSLARGLVNVQMAKDLEDFIGRLVGNSEYFVGKILERRSGWTLPKEEREWIDSILLDIDTHKDKDQEDPEPGKDEGNDDPNDESKEDEDQEGKAPGGGDHGGGNKGGSGGGQGGGGRSGTPSGKSGGSGRSSEEARHQKKFRSYIYTGHEDDEEQKDFEHSENWTEPINIKGMAIVMAYEKECKRHPVDMNMKERKNFEGYDIESKNDSGAVERIIEVKSTAGTWGQRGVTLSKTQFITALEKCDQYWLYIVEMVNDEYPRIFMIQNPAKKSEYFVFDDGWKDVAEIVERYNPKTDL